MLKLTGLLQLTRYLPLPVLKHYFNVSNSYVLHKLRLVLFPWRHKPWSRAHRHGAGSSAGVVTPGGVSSYQGMAGEANGTGKMQEGFAPPREDVNSPDLYIPVMAIVTYVLLVSVIRGLESRFHPEILGLVLSRALGIIVFEFVLIKLGCYLLNIIGEHTVVDLLAYSGYKFVGVILTLLTGLTRSGRLGYWTVWAYTTSANAFFLVSRTCSTRACIELTLLSSSFSYDLYVTWSCPTPLLPRASPSLMLNAVGGFNSSSPLPLRRVSLVGSSFSVSGISISFPITFTVYLASQNPVNL
jgi:hypothetical protein